MHIFLPLYYMVAFHDTLPDFNDYEETMLRRSYLVVQQVWLLFYLDCLGQDGAPVATLILDIATLE